MHPMVTAGNTCPATGNSNLKVTTADRATPGLYWVSSMKIARVLPRVKGAKGVCKK